LGEGGELLEFASGGEGKVGEDAELYGEGRRSRGGDGEAEAEEFGFGGLEAGHRDEVDVEFQRRLLNHLKAADPGGLPDGQADLVGVDEAAGGDGEAIDEAAIDAGEGPDGGAAGAPRGAEGDEVPSAVPEKGHGEGVEGSGEKFAGFALAAGFTVAKDFDEDAGLFEVVEAGSGAFDGKEVELVGAVKVEDGGVKAVGDADAHFGREGIGAGEDQAGANAEAVFGGGFGGDPVEGGGIEVEDLGLDLGEAVEDVAGRLKDVDELGAEGSKGKTNTRAGRGAEGDASAEIGPTEAEEALLAEAEGGEEAIFEVGAAGGEGFAGGATGAPLDEAKGIEAGGDEGFRALGLDIGAAQEGEAGKVVEGADLAGAELSAEEEGAIEGDAGKCVLDEGGEPRRVEAIVIIPAPTVETGGAEEGEDASELTQGFHVGKWRGSDDDEQEVPGFHGRADGGHSFLDAAGDGGVDDCVHLHGFHDQESVAFLDGTPPRAARSSCFPLPPNRTAKSLAHRARDRNSNKGLFGSDSAPLGGYLT